MKLPTLAGEEISAEQKEMQREAKLPYFIQKQYVRDKNLRRPGEDDYDPSTLDIPKQDFEKLSAAMQQYWAVKREHYDSILMYRFGEWYNVLYHDIEILNRLTEYNNWTAHYMTGFHENRLAKYTEILVRNGHKVVIVEQTETSRQMMKRVEEELAKDPNAKPLKIVSRKLYAIYTSGTYFNVEQMEPDPRYILSLESDGGCTYGVVFFDVTTLHFHVEQFEDDEALTRIRTLIMSMRPVEVICERALQGSQIVRMIRNSPIVPTFTFIGANDRCSYGTAVESVRKHFGDNES